MRGFALIALVLLLGCAQEGEPTGVCEPGLTLAGDSHTSQPGWADLVIESYEPGFARRAARGATLTTDFVPGAEVAEEFDIHTCEVMILLGTNDVLRGVPWQDFIRNMEAIVNDLIRRHGTHRVVMTIPPRLFFEPLVYSQAINNHLADYRSALFDLCERDMDDEIECGPDLYLILDGRYFEDDGIHLNGDGHSRVYDLVWDFLP